MPEFQLDPEAVRRLMAEAKAVREHPRWVEAFMWFCANFDRSYDIDPVISKLISDRSSYLIVFFLFGLCSENERSNIDGGSVYSRVREFAANHKLSSPNRATSIIKKLVRLGYIEETKSQDDGRSRNVTITPRGRMLIDVVTGSFYIPISMLGDTDYVDYAQKNKVFVGLSMKHFMDVYTTSYHAQFDKYFGTFLNTDSGFVLIAKVMASPGQFSENGNKLVNFSFTAAASRFQVSIGHVRRMFKEAERRGLVQLFRKGDLRIEILPLLINAISEFISILLAIALKASIRSARDIDNFAQWDAAFLENLVMGAGTKTQQ